MKKQILSVFLAVLMVMTMLPGRFYDSYAADGEFTASSTEGKNYVTLSWEGAAGSKFAITKSDGSNDIYETIPLKYSIKVLNVYPMAGNNLKNWMQTNGTGSPTVDGTKYTMTVDEINISNFNLSPSAYLGTPGNWKYDVVYFGAYDSNNNYDISQAARNLIEQFIKSSGGVLLGHDTASSNHNNFITLASTYLNLQTSNVTTSSSDYIPMYGNTKVKVARKGLLTNYPYMLGDVGTIMTTPESHSYHEFASGNIWFTYSGTNSNWDPSRAEMTSYKGKTGTNNFYLTTLNNIAMIQTGHSNGSATLDEQKILTNTLYYLAQTTNLTSFDDHSAQDLTAPSKVSDSITVSGNTLSFTESVDAGNAYRYKLYTVDDVNGTKTDTGKTAQTTVKTGLKGYSYVIDQKANSIGVDKTVEVTNASIDVSTLAPGNYYLHIRAVDNALNASEESILAFTKRNTGVVTLNKPVYNNDKSGYSFKSAAITNFTKVNSITFSLTNGTTVKSIPASLTPANTTETTNKEPYTYTYQFTQEMTISQAEEFIRGVVFNYVSGTRVSVTLKEDSSGDIAVGTYDLAIDGGVEEGASIALNEPVYSSGSQSEFSFTNAEVKNITSIYSITINLDNYTNVYSKPSTPAVSNELNNIAGTANTITYQFSNGITQADAQSFLRKLVFRYGGLKTNSTTNVNITVDGNKTNLPEGASITEFNGHYYIYVDDYFSWAEAYKRAKTYTYMGMKGYLATITSAQEDKVLDCISMNGAWSGGSRYTGTYDGNTAPSGAINQYFKWTCGPEAGTNYYYFNSVSNKYPVNGAYNGFVVLGEPNAYTAGGKTECCMQVHYFDEANPSTSTWNDLRDVIYNGAYNGSGYEPKVGYFVEFSDYNAGRVEGFNQNANGRSVVPIMVSRGSIFNRIKDGGTYYVDTVLTAFDRNITGITVDGTTFTNGSKLIGNRDHDYLIEAIDAESNSATITIHMKTIANISDSIKSLNVNNVQMSNKDDILNVKAALMAIDTTDASAAQKTEIANAIQNCKNLYFSLFSATATPVNGNNGWYRSGINNISLTAPQGFVISTSANGTWANAITVDKTDGDNKTAIYYLKEISTGDVSAAKVFNYKVDTGAPTGTITMRNNLFKEWVSTISFGVFLKNSVEVSIVGTDTLSNPVTILYKKVKKGETYNENGSWTSGSTFSVMANEEFSIFAGLVDDAGNMAVIGSNGVVLYTDSTQNTTNISFTKTSTADVTAGVNLNGNTVKEIKNGTNVLVRDTDYTETNGTITFKASYLNRLEINNYTLTISYNPMGENYVEKATNEAPATTDLHLAVKAKDMSETGGVATASVTIEPDSVVYTGNVFNPTVTIKDGSRPLVQDTDYTLGWTSDRINAGEKILTITFQGNYAGVITRNATITAATDNVISNLVMNGWTYGDSVNTPSATSKYGTIEYTYSNSENVTYTTTIPAEAGTYFVKASVAATDNYNSCEAKTSFIIADKPIETKNIEISGIKDSYIFKNSAITPEPIVTVNHTILRKDIDYTVAYENNIQIGTNALVKVILKGNYSGTADKNFAICYGTISEESINNIITLPNFNSEGWYNKDILIKTVGDWKLGNVPTGTFGTELTISEESGKEGTDYTFYIKAADGSIYERTLHYKLDKVAPEGSIAIKKSGINSILSAFSLDLLFNSDVDVTIASADDLSGVQKVEIYKAEKELTQSELDSVSWSEYKTSIHETAKDGTYIIYYSRITDRAGNKVIVNSNGVIFDTTAPVIKGIVNNGTYYTTQKVFVYDTGFYTVTVNNKGFESGGMLGGNTNATYTIVAVDKAGNKATMTVTMKPVMELSDPLNTIIEDDVKPGDQGKIEEIKKKAEAVDTTNATLAEKEKLQNIIDKCDRLLKQIDGSQKDKEEPKTGDTSNMNLWFFLLLISGGVLGIVVITNKRRKKNRQ